MNNKKFAIILAGCGVYDGAEIQEAVATLLAIDKSGGRYVCFAPDIPQFHVINHLNGETMKETRNVLVEAARIARGNIKTLSKLDLDDFDALVFPGGFGVAKNLCSFAMHGTDCSVNSEVEQVIRKAHAEQIPIAALCIAPTLIAKVLGKSILTIGTDEETATAIEKLGAIHQKTLGSEIVIDIENKIVSTPCYMHDTSIGVIARGAENAIEALYTLIN